MCLSTVLTTEHQVVCKNVAAVTQKDGKLVFTDIMGIPTVVEGSIEKVSRFMMPFIALLSTILIGWIKTPDYVIGEMERNGEHFRRKSVYRVMIRYIAPVMMLILFLQSTGILS